MDTEKLSQLNDRFQKKEITEVEFLREKKKLYDGEFRNQSSALKEATELPFGLSESNYMCLMNLIILLPSAGWIISIVLWLVGKDKSAEVDQQGKAIVNWLITWALLFVAVSVLVTISFAGSLVLSPTMVAGSLTMIPVVLLGLAMFILPIIGAVKSSGGKAFTYPLSIKVLK